MGKFKGVITAILTSFDKDGNIFEDGIRNQIKYLNDNYIQNVFICGSYGAFPVMNTKERIQVADVAVKEAKKNFMKTIVHIGSTSTREAVDLAKHAEDIGADAISAVVPYYYSTTIYNEKHFLKYFEEIISNVNIDVHCYNNAKTTGVNVSPSLLGKFIDLGLKGIKDGGSDMGSMLEMIDVVKEKKVNFDYYPSSTSSLITGFFVGATSCISGVSLSLPRSIINIYDNMLAMNIGKAITIWKEVMKARSILGKRCGRAIATYEVLNSKGVNVGTCRAPWYKLNSRASLEMIKELQEFGVNTNDKFFR